MTTETAPLTLAADELPRLSRLVTLNEALELARACVARGWASWDEDRDGALAIGPELRDRLRDLGVRSIAGLSLAQAASFL